MRTQKKVSILAAVTLFVLVMTGCSETKKQTSAEKTQSERAENAAPMTPAQETPQVFDGELMKVDATAKTLSVKNSEGREIEFRYNDQTLISGADGGVEGLATKSGTPVSVQFDMATRTAAKVEVRQRQK
jgi:ABC-type Fe3+-hydroxamate transport system substrate-binding protein